MLDEQYKLSLLAFMGLLYGTDIAESWIPLTRGHCWGALTPPPHAEVLEVPPSVFLPKSHSTMQFMLTCAISLTRNNLR